MKMKNIVQFSITVLSFIFGATLLVLGVMAKIPLIVGVIGFSIFALVSIRIPVRILTEEEDD